MSRTVGALRLPHVNRLARLGSQNLACMIQTFYRMHETLHRHRWPCLVSINKQGQQKPMQKPRRGGRRQGAGGRQRRHATSSKNKIVVLVHGDFRSAPARHAPPCTRRRVGCGLWSQSRNYNHLITSLIRVASLVCWTRAKVHQLVHQTSRYGQARAEHGTGATLEVARSEFIAITITITLFS